jgi:Putative DNA-binding domain
VPALADLQAAIRTALVTGEPAGVEALLIGGIQPRERLAIHQRHYATSLTTALLERFPATVWLVGSAVMTAAAQQFVRERPPTRPCIAEYGEAFPAFLAAHAGATGVPYLCQFAELEWHLGRLSLQVGVSGVTASGLAVIDAARLPEAKLTLQPGVHYLQADWAVDELISVYLADNAPEEFVLQSGRIWLELRGIRGELRMHRLTPADFAFRTALAGGAPLGDAALAALDVDSSFDPGAALRMLLDEGVVASIDAAGAEGAA